MQLYVVFSSGVDLHAFDKLVPRSVVEMNCLYVEVWYLKACGAFCACVALALLLFVVVASPLSLERWAINFVHVVMCRGA